MEFFFRNATYSRRALNSSFISSSSEIQEEFILHYTQPEESPTSGSGAVHVIACRFVNPILRARIIVYIHTGIYVHGVFGKCMRDLRDRLILSQLTPLDAVMICSCRRRRCVRPERAIILWETRLPPIGMQIVTLTLCRCSLHRSRPEMFQRSRHSCTFLRWIMHHAIVSYEKRLSFFPPVFDILCQRSATIPRDSLVFHVIQTHNIV